MNTPTSSPIKHSTSTTTPPPAPKKKVTTITPQHTMEPKTLQFDKVFTPDPIPPNLQQPIQPIEFVYPNDGESEFYTYEQMCNDWIPSDIEYPTSSDEEEEVYINDPDEW